MKTIKFLVVLIILVSLISACVPRQGGTGVVVEKKTEYGQIYENQIYVIGGKVVLIPQWRNNPCEFKLWLEIEGKDGLYKKVFCVRADVYNSAVVGQTITIK